MYRYTGAELSDNVTEVWRKQLAGHLNAGHQNAGQQNTEHHNSESMYSYTGDQLSDNVTEVRREQLVGHQNAGLQNSGHQNDQKTLHQNTEHQKAENQNARHQNASARHQTQDTGHKAQNAEQHVEQSEWVLVPTPESVETLHIDQWREQTRLAQLAMTRANIQGRYTVGEYIARFGLLKPSDAFGCDVFTGMRREWARYRWRHRFVGKLYLGWFIIPEPFSQQNAQSPIVRPPTDLPQQNRNVLWFPAFFEYWDENRAQMACLNLVAWDSRPWTVHASRCILILAEN